MSEKNRSGGGMENGPESEGNLRTVDYGGPIDEDVIKGLTDEEIDFNIRECSRIAEEEERSGNQFGLANAAATWMGALKNERDARKGLDEKEQK